MDRERTGSWVCEEKFESMGNEECVVAKSMIVTNFELFR
jgi:hypothetical protein